MLFSTNSIFYVHFSSCLFYWLCENPSGEHFSHFHEYKYFFFLFFLQTTKSKLNNFFYNCKLTSVVSEISFLRNERWNNFHFHFFMAIWATDFHVIFFFLCVDKTNISLPLFFIFTAMQLYLINNTPILIIILHDDD